MDDRDTDAFSEVVLPGHHLLPTWQSVPHFLLLINLDGNVFKVRAQGPPPLL